MPDVTAISSFLDTWAPTQEIRKHLEELPQIEQRISEIDESILESIQVLLDELRSRQHVTDYRISQSLEDGIEQREARVEGFNRRLQDDIIARYTPIAATISQFSKRVGFRETSSFEADAICVDGVCVSGDGHIWSRYDFGWYCVRITTNGGLD